MTGEATCPACGAANVYDLPLDADRLVRCHGCAFAFAPPGALPLPLRAEPWGPRGPGDFERCPVCAGPWRPWALSRLPCHARCLFPRELGDELLVLCERFPKLTQRRLAADLGVSLAVLRAILADARARRRHGPSARRPTNQMTSDGEPLVVCCGYLCRESEPCLWCGEPAWGRERTG